MSSTGTMTSRSSSFAPARRRLDRPSTQTNRPISSSGRCVAERPMRWNGAGTSPSSRSTESASARRASSRPPRAPRHDRRVDRRSARGPRGQHQEKRLRRRDQDVRRLRSIAARSFCGVSPVRTATLTPTGGPQRPAQVPLDVVVERLERRDVENAEARSGRRSEPIDRVEERGERLARAGRRLDQRVRAAAITGRPVLRRHRRRERALEPGSRRLGDVEFSHRRPGGPMRFDHTDTGTLTCRIRPSRSCNCEAILPMPGSISGVLQQPLDLRICFGVLCLADRQGHVEVTTLRRPEHHTLVYHYDDDDQIAVDIVRLDTRTTTALVARSGTSSSKASGACRGSTSAPPARRAGRQESVERARASASQHNSSVVRHSLSTDDGRRPTASATTGRLQALRRRLASTTAVRRGSRATTRTWRFRLRAQAYDRPVAAPRSPLFHRAAPCRLLATNPFALLVGFTRSTRRSRSEQRLAGRSGSRPGASARSTRSTSHGRIDHVEKPAVHPPRLDGGDPASPSRWRLARDAAASVDEAADAERLRTPARLPARHEGAELSATSSRTARWTRHAAGAARTDSAASTHPRPARLPGRRRRRAPSRPRE